MECKKCGCSLLIVTSRFESDKNSTEVRRIDEMVCINEKCESYCGKDLSKPKIIEQINVEIV